MKDKFFMKETQQLVEGSKDQPQQRYTVFKKDREMGDLASTTKMLVRDNNDKVQQGSSDLSQPKDNLEIEIEEVRKLMLKKPQQKRYAGQRRIKDNML